MNTTATRTRLRSLAGDVVRALPSGARLRIELFVRAGQVEEPELLMVQRLLSRRQIFVDVGANEGLYIRAGLCSGATVIAVEPHPRMAANLTKEFGERIQLIEAAAAPSEGEATLYVPVTAGAEVETRSSLKSGANPGFDQLAVQVRTAPMDALVDRADVVKIDVEGAEAEVITSASRLLDECAPTVLVEVESRHHPNNPARAFELMAAAGYRGWFLKPDGWRRFVSIDQFDFDRYQPAGLLEDRFLAQQDAPTLPARPEGYVNNFLFVHPRRLSAVRQRLRLRGWRLERQV